MRNTNIKNMAEKKNRDQSNYATIKLTREFVSIIDWIVANSDLNFESRTDVIKSAVRELYSKERAKKIGFK